jgi:hypothetical protein
MKKTLNSLRPPDGAPTWQSGPHRFFFRFFVVCLALYLAYAAFLSRSGLFASAADTVSALLWFALIAAGLYLLLVWLSERPSPRAAAPFARARLSGRVFALCAGFSLAILGVFLAQAYPGGVSVDSAVQWTQAVTGDYSNWHPVFHTLLLRLCALVAPNYTLALVAQCVLFSLAAGYLAATLHAWGMKAAWLVPALALCVASPIVGNTMMYMWKDNAMTAGVLVLGAQAVNLYFSRGEWLGKTRNALAFGLALAFTTLVRHNALLFTVPLLVTALLTCRGQLRGALRATAALVMASALVLGPLYASLDVTYPNNTVEESIGIPMTIICDARAQNPDALDADTRAFTDAMTDEAGWEDYQINSYNSIKFGTARAVVSHETLSQILTMARSTAEADPAGAFATINGVTDLVWGLGSENAADVTVRNSGNLATVVRQNGRVNRAGTAVKALITAPLSLNVLSWYFGNLGVSFALMLVFALRALRRNGPRTLLLCLPTLLYNLGTMCVLCGNDARFFSFSPIWCTLSLFALSRDPAAANENKVEEVNA